MRLIGIDGARLGQWVLASRNSDGADPPTFEVVRDLSELFSLARAGDATIVIDVPIGILSTRTAIAGRTCDAQARKAVGPIRASSVFTAPCREAFGSPNHPQASARNREACGRGLSRQAFGILSRIEAVDALMTPSLQHGIREGHPEVTFARLAGRLLADSKTTQAGREERLSLLEGRGIAFDLDAERFRLGRGFVSRDDMRDAAAMLVSAQRVISSVVVVLGDDSAGATRSGVTHRLSIRFTARAARQVEQARRWWRQNRPKAPGAVREELDRALDLLAVQPDVGAKAAGVALGNRRSITTARTRTPRARTIQRP